MKRKRKPSKIKIDRRKSIFFVYYEEKPEYQIQYRCKCKDLLSDSEKFCSRCGVRIHWFGKAPIWQYQRAKGLEEESSVLFKLLFDSTYLSNSVLDQIKDFAERIASDPIIKKNLMTRRIHVKPKEIKTSDD